MKKIALTLAALALGASAVTAAAPQADAAKMDCNPDYPDSCQIHQ